MGLKIEIVAENGDTLRADAERDNLLKLLQDAGAKDGIRVRVSSSGIGTLQSADPSTLHLILTSSETTYAASALAGVLMSWLARRNHNYFVKVKGVAVKILRNLPPILREKIGGELTDAIADGLEVTGKTPPQNAVNKKPSEKRKPAEKKKNRSKKAIQSHREASKRRKKR